MIFIVAVLAMSAALAWWYFGERAYAKPFKFVSTLTGTGKGLQEPFGVAVSGGDIYVSDGDAGKIWLLRDGNLTVAANGFDTPSAIAFDTGGGLIVADTGSHVIRKVSIKGDVSVIAGVLGRRGSEDGDAAKAQFNGPMGIAADDTGRIFVADTYNDRIRVIENGTVRTLAGGVTGSADGVGGAAQFDTPTGIALWRDKLLVADAGNRRIRVVEPDGRVWTFAGDGNADIRDGSLLSASFYQPTALAVSASGEIYITDGNTVRVIAGYPLPLVRTLSAKQRGLSDGMLSTARFSRPSCIALTGNGDLLVTDSDNRLLRTVTGSKGGREISADEVKNMRETADEFRSLQPPRWPYDPPDAKRDIAGTLGEIRGEIPYTDEPARFHNGLDIAGAYGETARFVRTEKVLRPIATDGIGKLRESLRMPTMGYVHIRLGRNAAGVPFDDQRFEFIRDGADKITNVRVPRGSVFSAGEAVGTLNPMNHVHLIAGRTGAEMNALDALVLPNLTDTRPPTIEDVSLYDQNWQQLQPLSPNAIIKMAGKTRLIIRAFDQVDGNAERRRLGIYKAGWQLLNSDRSPAGAPTWNILLDRMPPSAAVQFVYGPGSRSGATGQTIFNYIATNMVEGEHYSEGFVDPAQMAAGTYILRALVADQAGNISQRDVTIQF